MMNSNDRRIYLAGARALACVPVLAIAGVATGALMARGAPVLAKSRAREVTESVFRPSSEMRQAIDPKLEASAAPIGPTDNPMLGTSTEAITAPPSRPCRRPSHWRRAASLPTSLEERVARTGSICEMRQLQMGPVGRSVRYCHF